VNNPRSLSTFVTRDFPWRGQTYLELESKLCSKVGHIRAITHKPDKLWGRGLSQSSEGREYTLTPPIHVGIKPMPTSGKYEGDAHSEAWKERGVVIWVMMHGHVKEKKGL